MNPLNIICYLKFIEEGKNYVFVQKLNSNILENLKLEFHRERVLVDEWCLSLTYKPNSTYVIVGSCPNTKLSAKVNCMMNILKEIIFILDVLRMAT
jgi:hypothetical protein